MIYQGGTGTEKRPLDSDQAHKKRAVDFALTSVSWSVASGARKQPCDPPLLLFLAKHISNDAGVSSRGGERRGEAGLWRDRYQEMIVGVHTEPFGPPEHCVRRSTHIGTRHRYPRFPVGLVWLQPNTLNSSRIASNPVSIGF